MAGILWLMSFNRVLSISGENEYIFPNEFHATAKAGRRFDKNDRNKAVIEKFEYPFPGNLSFGYPDNAVFASDRKIMRGRIYTGILRI